MSAIARRLDATEGQLWSLAIGLVVAAVLALAGIPPVVHHAREPRSASAPVARTATSHTRQALTPVTAPVVAAPASDDLTVVTPRRSRTGSAASSEAATTPSRPEPFGTVRVLATVPSPLGGVAFAGGRVYVATTDDKATRIYGFDASGSRTADITVTGHAEHASGLTALSAEEGGTLVGTDVDTSRVLRIDPASGSITTLATIVDLPSCVLAPGAPQCEPGLEDHKPHLTGIAAAANGTVLVADSGQATIWRLRDGARPEPWSQSVQQASGDGPTAIAIAADGSVVETVGTDLNPSNATAAGVYRVPVTSDGSAGAPVLVAKLARAAQPVGIATSPDGRIFVALRATSAVVVIGADGTEQARLTGDDLDSPAGLTLGSAGELFGTTDRFDKPGRVFHITV